ncbi:MAG: hypothetical protein JXR96_14930 [Deltaproteobacteria bacterium]|nr:hypothetical protein [Deltaproteobacteria bacterium]
MGAAKKAVIGLVLLALAGAAVVIIYPNLARDSRTGSAVEPRPEPPASSLPDGWPRRQAEPEPGSEQPEEPAPDLAPVFERRLGRLAEKSKRKPRPKTAEPHAKDEELDAALVVEDTRPPPLRVLQPVDRSYVMSPEIELRVRSEAGASVRAGKVELSELAGGLFTGRLQLVPGPNRLQFEARDSVGNQIGRSVLVTYVDPGRIQRSKDRFASLLQQLDEIRGLAGQIDKQIAELIERIQSTDDADLVNRLSRELRTIRSSRRALEGEIEQAIQGIDKLLAAH